MARQYTNESSVSHLNPCFRKGPVKGHYCPGFNLWEVTVREGHEFAGTYVVDADNDGGVVTRLFFATNGRIRETGDMEIRFIKANPDADIWDTL